MRHTDAPGGAGDPPGFRVDDCATQRNLSAKGRADAARIGARLRSEGIAVERILSSPWCRCMDTATLLELGPVEAEPTFGNVVVLSDQRESLIAGARGRQVCIAPLDVANESNLEVATGRFDVRFAPNRWCNRPAQFVDS
jgi:Histidine phosphatase superfamily (branch 1)